MELDDRLFDASCQAVFCQSASGSSQRAPATPTSWQMASGNVSQAWNARSPSGVVCQVQNVRLYPIARGQGRLVCDLPVFQADQDRRPCCAPRPRHHLPTRRGGGHGPDGARHPCRDPATASATAMRVTAIPAQTERNRQDRSVRRAEKQGRRAGMTRVHNLIRPTSGVSATADTARGKKTCFAGNIRRSCRQAAGHLGNVGADADNYNGHEDRTGFIHQ